MYVIKHFLMDKFITQHNKSLLWSIINEQFALSSLTEPQLMEFIQLFEQQILNIKTSAEIAGNKLSLIQLNKNFLGNMIEPTQQFIHKSTTPKQTINIGEPISILPESIIEIPNSIPNDISNIVPVPNTMPTNSNSNQSSELYTAEAIRNHRRGTFDQQVAQHQNDFNSVIQSNVPLPKDFRDSEKGTEKIKNLDEILAQTAAMRKYDTQIVLPAAPVSALSLKQVSFNEDPQIIKNNNVNEFDNTVIESTTNDIFNKLKRQNSD